MNEEMDILHCRIVLETKTLIVIDIMNRNKYEMFTGAQKKEGVFQNLNPLYRQTSLGLFLQFWGSRPYSVITPWGEWYLCGPFDCERIATTEDVWWQNILPELKEKLNLVLYRFGQDIKIKTIHGPIYRICQKGLPEPVEQTYSFFKSSDGAHAEWKRLVEIVQKQK